ncbi:MAG: cutA [Rickettsiaceae bacterium]|jgi:periplasmic divalent cation tolerance protein|nr:cutA [Rickettsiaceae bacterium]
MNQYCLIKTTFKNKNEAKKLAKILLQGRLVACAQISIIESLYSWEGKMVGEKEFLLSLKTKTSFYKKIEKIIIQNHSYKIPQIIAVPVSKISKAYLDWVESCLI